MPLTLNEAAINLSYIAIDRLRVGAATHFGLTMPRKKAGIDNRKLNKKKLNIATFTIKKQKLEIKIK